MSQMKKRLLDIAQERLLQKLETVDVDKVRDFMSDRIDSFKTKDDSNLKRAEPLPNLSKMESCDDFQSISGSRDLDFLQRSGQVDDNSIKNSVIIMPDEDEHVVDSDDNIPESDINKSLLNEESLNHYYTTHSTNSVQQLSELKNHFEQSKNHGNDSEKIVERVETTIEENKKQNDLQNFVQKKSIAQGMMDLALVSANTNQLRYVMDMSTRHPYFFTSILLIITSLLLQVVVGLALIWNSRYNIRKKQEMDRADRVNNLSVIGVFLITLINVFISTFNGSSSSLPPETKATDAPATILPNVSDPLPTATDFPVLI